MIRLLCALGVGAIVLLQPAVALAAPSPSPALDGILLAPPETGFVEANTTTPGIFEGPFDAAGYATITATANATEAKNTLSHDGFVGGYGRTWVNTGAKHIYVEAVMAFNGANGAKAWLGQSETADKAEATYQHSISISGISTYYGARLVDTANSVYADAYVFVKGNDTYLVSTVSTSDDLATTAATQTRRQYDSAPPYTIPPADWPETKLTKAAVDVGKVVGGAFVGLVILAMVVAAFLILMRRRRSSTLQPVPVYGSTAAAAPVPPAAVQMSDDRRSWWDGTTWKDAEHEVPPNAQRSGDGHFWWDGQAWRSVPGGGPTT